MNEFDLEFIELSHIADDPELLKQLNESFADPDFDEYWENPDSVDDWESV